MEAEYCIFFTVEYEVIHDHYIKCFLYLIHTHPNTQKTPRVSGDPMHLQQVGCSSDAHAGDRLPLAFGEAAVPGTLAGERAERGDPGGEGTTLRQVGRPGGATVRLIWAAEGSSPCQGIYNLA